jgi:hypothetical protein
VHQQRFRTASLVPYASRHSTATPLQELGVPEEARMAIMGQSSAAAHVYVHISQDQTRLALVKLEELLALEWLPNRSPRLITVHGVNAGHTDGVITATLTCTPIRHTICV